MKTHLGDDIKHITAKERADWNKQYTLLPVESSNKVELHKDGVKVSEIDLTRYLDDTNLARLTSGIVDINGLATFTRDDGSHFTVDLSNLKDPQVQADFNQVYSDQPDFIKNSPKPIIDVLKHNVGDYSVTTYKIDNNDISGLDFSLKKIYVVAMPLGAVYVFFKTSQSSRETALRVANNVDLCVMLSNAEAILQRSNDYTLANFNVFKVLQGGSWLFTPVNATRTAKIAINSIKGTNSLAIKDKNDVTKFEVTDSLSFDENFTFDLTKKEVGFNTSPFQQLTARFIKNALVKNSINITTNETVYPERTPPHLYYSLGKPFKRDTLSIYLLKIFISKDIYINDSIGTVNPYKITYKCYLKPKDFSLYPTHLDKILLFSQEYTDNFNKINGGIKC